MLIVWVFAQCPVTSTKCHDSVVAAVKENYCASSLKEALSSENSPPHLLVLPLALSYGFRTDHVCCFSIKVVLFEFTSDVTKSEKIPHD